MLRLGLACTVLSFGTIVFFSRSLLLNYVFLFAVGIFSCFRLNIGFIYGNEIIPRKYTKTVGSLYNTLDAGTMIMTALYFNYISKAWVYLATFFFCISMVSLVLSLFLPESPKYLVAKGDFKNAKMIYNEIARVNNR